MLKAKVVTRRGIQSIRLPKEIQLKSAEVFIERTPHGLRIDERDPWEIFLEGCREISTKTLLRSQPRLEKRRRS
ncbi:MAG TPA: hypothetical protein VF773_00195 [Verrucomicrobiae bacterium]